MLYNKVEKFNYIETAGKITIAAAVSGLLVFAFVFLFNAGKTELLKVEAQGGAATTTLTVLNTPPIWLDIAVEEFESSTTTPTNSGSQVSWVARAENSGGAPYFLLICSTNATPTARAAADLASVGSMSPLCGAGAIQWGVSTATADQAQARVATTTTEVAPFAQVNDWYGWVCDDDPVNPRCNDVSYQGTNATNSSPFIVNFRPTFTAFSNTSPADPGSVITFHSTSSDTDTEGGEDLLTLYVCNANDFTTSPVGCGVAGTIATTTVPVTADASAAFTLPAVIQDDTYDAFGFIVDNHGHAASGGAQGDNNGFVVNNVAPTVPAGGISINGGADIALTVEAGETLNFSLAFETSDANSCEAAGGGDEMVGYVVSLYRSSIGTSTCNGLAGSYNPNNCYPSGSPSSVWNLSCTASSTSCTPGGSDPTQLWSCTFPLWFVAEPTDVISPFAADDWVAAIAGIDNDNATGTATIGSNPVTLLSFPAIDLITGEIPYGSLEPGDNTGTLDATTTVLSVGNTGLNQELEGEAMCPGFAVGNECPNSASSTIPDFQQEFGTSSVAYGSGFNLSSSTQQLLELKVPKTTSTSTPNTGTTYWGIEVPIAITVAGAYTGLNTFYAVTSSSTDW